MVRRGCKRSLEPREQKSPKSLSEAAKRAFFFTIPFANLRGNVVRTFLGKSDFYWPLMVLVQCSLCFPMSYANVLSVQSSVPCILCSFFANQRVTNGRALPSPSLLHHPKPVLHRCKPILHPCKPIFAPWAQKTFCTLS